MKIDKKGIFRFLKYSSVGVSTFLFDLLLLYIFVSIFNVDYMTATGLAFFIAVSINYFLSRKYVFSKTNTFLTKGYFTFMLFALFGIRLTLGGMYVLVRIFGIYYLLARCLISVCVGTINYLSNLYLNFKVSGNH
jgi:putative flippase GtrA